MNAEMRIVWRLSIQDNQQRLLVVAIAMRAQTNLEIQRLLEERRRRRRKRVGGQLPATMCVETVQEKQINVTQTNLLHTPKRQQEKQDKDKDKGVERRH